MSMLLKSKCTDNVLCVNILFVVAPIYLTKFSPCSLVQYLVSFLVL